MRFRRSTAGAAAGQGVLGTGYRGGAETREAAWVPFMAVQRVRGGGVTLQNVPNSGGTLLTCYFFLRQDAGVKNAHEALVGNAD